MNDSREAPRPIDALDWIENEAFSCSASIPAEAYRMFQIVRGAVQAARVGDRPVGWVNPHEVGLGGIWLPHGLAATYSLPLFAGPVQGQGDRTNEGRWEVVAFNVAMLLVVEMGRGDTEAEAAAGARSARRLVDDVCADQGLTFPTVMPVRRVKR